MKEYHKIQTVYLRDPENRNKTLLEGQWAKPEFKVLKDIIWIGTEKIDGTNIRVIWDGSKVTFNGKTDNAQIPSNLVNYLQDTFTDELMASVFSETPACLYGEGFGKKIQKCGADYIENGVSYILFDVNIGGWWLERGNVEDIAGKLSINVVPILFTGTLEEGIDMVKNGYKSTISQNPELIAEGLILKPDTELFNRKGERIVTKVKYKDFRR